MKKIFAFTLGIFLVFFCFCFTGCNEHYDDGNTVGDDILLTYFDPDLPDGTVEFTDLILNTQNFERIIPLGQINPPGHIYPTDHIYFVLATPASTSGDLPNLDRPVYAPTGGKILNIGEPNSYGDQSIRIGVTNTVCYYLDHIFASEGLKVGDSVEAGAQIGITGNTSCVDFGVMNKNVNNAFLSTNYPLVTLYGDKPLKYYTEELQTQLYSLIKPAKTNDPDYVYDGGVTDGEFVQDKAGSLKGNWLEENSANSSAFYDSTDMLSFTFDIYFTDQIRIAVGLYSNAFALKNSDNPIAPEDVSTESGLVTYYLYNANNTELGEPTGDCMGLMLVQMLDESRLRLQIFEGVTSGTQNFTSEALIYVR